MEQHIKPQTCLTDLSALKVLLCVIIFDILYHIEFIIVNISEIYIFVFLEIQKILLLFLVLALHKFLIFHYFARISSFIENLQKSVNL